MIVVAAALALEAWALYVVGASPERWRPAMIVKDEPAARAVYDAMIEAIHRADNLSYTNVCSGPDGRESCYTVWLAKPGFFHIELTNGPSSKRSTLIGDGNDLWVFWSGDRPYLWCDDQESFDKTSSNVYIRRAALPGSDSVAGEVARLGIAWFGCVLDPSTFHRRADTFDPYMDGICSRGANRVGGEKCDVIEISYMGAQRTRHLWISRRDHLPRRIKEIVRVTDSRVSVEEWSNIAVNSELPPDTFAWSPPAEYRTWDIPKPEDTLVKAGQEAPDFELCAFDDGKIGLSDYRGKVVWLYLWQCGSPLCRELMRQLQGLYEQHEDSGLVVLGFNYTDDPRILRSFLQKNPVTFRTIHDCSAPARKTVIAGYGNKRATVPMSCIIDRQGRVVDAWLGYDGDHKRALAALEKAGLQLK